jgi:hypothetical protein
MHPQPCARSAFQKAQNRAQPLSLTCLNIARYEPGSPEALFAGATSHLLTENLSAYQLSVCYQADCATLHFLSFSSLSRQHMVSKFASRWAR